MSDLKDKVALVTGGGQGIGAAISTLLAKRGAAVAIGDINAAEASKLAAQLNNQGLRALSIDLDVTQAASVRSALDQTEAKLGPLDILVNNAAIASQQPFDAISEDSWDATFNVNTKAVFFLCQAVAVRFAGRTGGRIINISSYAGKEAIPEYASYCGSKFALTGITQTLALEFAPRGVTVNAVCPGIVRTPLWERLPEEQWIRQTAKVPLGRGQTPEDIAEAVGFLASEAARNVTGASIPVTGGLSMW